MPSCAGGGGGACRLSTRPPCTSVIDAMSCLTPSSKTSNSSFVRSATNWSCSSRTITSVVTRSMATRKSGPAPAPACRRRGVARRVARARAGRLRLPRGRGGRRQHGAEREPGTGGGESADAHGPQYRRTSRRRRTPRMDGRRPGQPPGRASTASTLGVDSAPCRPARLGRGPARRDRCAASRSRQAALTAPRAGDASRSAASSGGGRASWRRCLGRGARRAGRAGVGRRRRRFADGGPASVGAAGRRGRRVAAADARRPSAGRTARLSGRPRSSAGRGLRLRRRSGTGASTSTGVIDTMSRM